MQTIRTHEMQETKDGKGRPEETLIRGTIYFVQGIICSDKAKPQFKFLIGILD